MVLLATEAMAVATAREVTLVMKDCPQLHWDPDLPAE
jgi:hypothetical protein